MPETKALKTYLLTGCASGIGKHLATELLSRGHNVVATDLAFEHLKEQTADWPQDRLLVEALDVCDPERWGQVLEEALRRFGSIDGVMNIAGYLQAAWVHEIEDKDIHRHFDVNVKGVIFGTRAAAQVMRKQGHGHIVNIASMAALAPVPGLSLYSASKYAVRSFSLAAAQELRSAGVAVTVVCPDAVQTPMLDKQKGDERAALTFSGPTRFLQVEDISSAILDRVLVKRPLEYVLPRHRALLARLGDWFPELTFRIAPLLTRRGRKQQQKFLKDQR
jgi:3-oxoacyl-[acyl-carrier protein] reductase